MRRWPFLLTFVGGIQLQGFEVNLLEMLLEGTQIRSNSGMNYDGLTAGGGAGGYKNNEMF